MTLAAPSDTHHLASLLDRMDPKISSEGKGSVTIGGFRYDIEQQMLEDFRSHDLSTSLQSLIKPVLAFHSPSDETVSYEHAIRICGFNNENEKREPRSLITLPGSNHLLTDESHCQWVAQLMDTWCKGI
jgi:putative redox protein